MFSAGPKRFAHGLLILLVCTAASSALAAPTQSWVATARIRSGNTTLTSSPDPAPPAGPTDSTGLLEANGSDIEQMPPIDAGAIAEYDVPNGTLVVGGGFGAEANFPDRRVFEPFGGASTLYSDSISVSSSTLSPGTPVTLRFVFALGFTTGVSSTHNLATARADISSVINGAQVLQSSSNRYFESLETGLLIQNGLFSPPQSFEHMVETTVGSTLSFSVSLDGDAFGEVFVTGGVGNEVNGQSDGWMSAAVVFGGEAVSADAQLTSELLAGPFPAADMATTQAAEAATIEDPFPLPEPDTGLASGVALICLVGIRRASLTRIPSPLRGRSAFQPASWYS